MRGPTLVLPRDSMPWGRWLEGANEEAAAAIRSQASDLSSIGSQFASRADTLSNQIQSISNVSTQYTTVIPDFTLSKSSGSFLDPNVMFESPPVTFVPPRPDRAYRLLLFCNMSAEQVAGTSNLDYTWTFMMVGDRVYRQPALEENRNGLFTAENFTKIASVAATKEVSYGEPTTVRMGLMLDPFNAKTVVFRGCSFTAVYVGGL